MNKSILDVTQTIVERSRDSRKKYLDNVAAQNKKGKTRSSLSCGNLAHTVASCGQLQKSTILDFTRMNLGIVTAYNDMLSAHQPYKDYPEIIAKAVSDFGHSAQVAGGVPAMCDGVTQGQDGMDLSLFSRDLIAQSTALSLSHNTFDAIVLLGVCDKIAPGQLMGALAFGHLPAAFIPSGPMGTGISNDEKVAIRQKHVSGDVGDEALQNMECSAYHSPGTCTFYGTANTNQLVFEAMGLMLPGSSFVSPTSVLRQKLTEKMSQHLATQPSSCADVRNLAKVVDEKAVVNGLIALLASGGSTNHTIHLIAIARAAGWIITWDDLDKLSDIVPLLARMYPNGPADINEFQRAGGVPVLLKTLSERGLFHMDATPIYGSMQDYLSTPSLNEQGELIFIPADSSENGDVIAKEGDVFSAQGGLKVLSGNLGRGVMKVSAVAKENQLITAPASVFDSQYQVKAAYQKGLLNKDSVIVVRFNGPAANGMPELHMLMPILGNIMKAGHKVALVTDGRLSGASGKVPAAIHVTPEARHGGLLGYIEDGDIITVNAITGELNVAGDVASREPASIDLSELHIGTGRELFSVFRHQVSSAETGATILYSTN